MATIAWPDYLIVKSIDTINNVAAVSSEARNKKIFNRKIGGQRFDFNLRMNVKPWDTKKSSGFLFALQDDDTYTSYSDVTWAGTASNTVTDGAITAGSKSATLDDVTDLEAGDWMNFGNHTKLYKILYIVGSTVTLNTNILFGVPSGTFVELQSPSALLELAPELKASTTFSEKLHKDLASFNARFVEVL